MKSCAHTYIALAVLLGALVVGCRGGASRPPPTLPASATPATGEPAPLGALERVSDRTGNPEGGVLILEYHKVARKEARWDRSIEKFRGDLERLYRMGFRPVTLGAYLEGKMELPPGASPVVFTFDDSHPSQFRLLEDGSLDPDCALGVWQSFAAENPDFPIRASFFVLPPSGPWGQPALADKKFAMLKAWGCEVGSHTVNHVNLRIADERTVLAELEGAARYIRAKGFEPFAIALPYGASPKRTELLERFHRAALLVGAGPAPAPGSKALDPMRLPRIQAIEGRFGITYWLDRIEKGEFAPYVEP